MGTTTFSAICALSLSLRYWLTFFAFISVDLIGSPCCVGKEIKWERGIIFLVWH